MRKTFRTAGFLLGLLSAPAMAADLVAGACEGLGSVENLAEPWEETSRTFYNGRVRVALSDAIEPACCWAHVIILLPNPDDELGGRQCVLINRGNFVGLSGVDFDKMTAKYDPATGLTISLPYRLYDAEEGASGPLKFGRVIVNLADGTVRTE